LIWTLWKSTKSVSGNANLNGRDSRDGAGRMETENVRLYLLFFLFVDFFFVAFFFFFARCFRTSAAITPTADTAAINLAAVQPNFFFQ
jgi:hypothetical protein